MRVYLLRKSGYKEITAAEIVKYVLMKSGNTVIDYPQGQLSSKEGLQGFKDEIASNKERVCLIFINPYIPKEVIHFLQKISTEHKIVILTKTQSKLSFEFDNLVYGENGFINDLKDYVVAKFARKSDLTNTELINLDKFCELFDKRSLNGYLCNLYLMSMTDRNWNDNTLAEVIENGRRKSDKMNIDCTVDINLGIKLQVYAATHTTAQYLYWLYNRLGLIEQDNCRKIFFTDEEIEDIQNEIFDSFKTMQDTVKKLNVSLQSISNTYGVQYAKVLLVKADILQECVNELILRLYAKEYGAELIVCSFNGKYSITSRLDKDALQRWCKKNGVENCSSLELDSYLKNPTNFFKVNHSKVKLSGEMSQNDLKNIIANMR